MDVVDVKVGQHMAGLWACVVVQPVSPGQWGHPPQVRAGASSPTPMLSGLVYPHLWWGVGPSLPSAGTSSLVAVSSEGQGHFSQGQWRTDPAQHGLLISSCMVSKTPFSNMCHRHQHRPQLLQDHTPSHSLWQQPWPWMSSWSQVTGSASPSEWHSPSGNVAMALTWPQVVLILDINWKTLFFEHNLLNKKTDYLVIFSWKKRVF